MVKVAVITRTKDRPELLKRALDSVASQTHEGYIHVIVNDGGSSEEVEKLFAKLDATQRKKTKLFNRLESSGAPDTIFNESIDRVDSEYFAIHDDDDTWHPEFLERTVDRMDSNDRLGAVVVRTDKVIEEIGASSVKTKKTSRYMPDLSAISLYRQCIDNQFTPIATLFRRSAYEKVGKFDSSLPVVGDWEFGIRLLSEYEADFVDPGYALANYHHRISTGDNSFASHNHRKYVTLVANRYLRQDLKEGKLGLGYIISKLKYDEDIRHSIVKNILPSAITNILRKRRR